MAEKILQVLPASGVRELWKIVNTNTFSQYIRWKGTNVGHVDLTVTASHADIAGAAIAATAAAV